MRHHDVWMDRPTLRGLPAATAPRGYRLRAYRPGDAAAWVAIHRRADPGNHPSLSLFRRQFPGTDALRARRMIFAVDAAGRPVGTVTAWYAHHGPSGTVGQLHWLAVLPLHQGRGLGWALTARCLRVMKRFHQSAYLNTSTARPDAIRLYLRAGFTPRIGGPASARIWARALREQTSRRHS